MRKCALLTMTGLTLALAAGLPPVGPASAQEPAAKSAGSADLALSAQQRRVRVVREPVRIRITPLYRNPGPNAVRQCTSWLAPEWRPSGTVIVPRMQCWWEPG